MPTSEHEGVENSGLVQMKAELTTSSPQDAVEQEAHEVAHRVISGEKVEVGQTATANIHGNWLSDIGKSIWGQVSDSSKIVKKAGKKAVKKAVKTAVSEAALESLPAGSIREATRHLAKSTEEIDRNTAARLINGDIKAFYIDDLQQPPDVEKLVRAKVCS